ncbi:alpha/beta fold hydrolase [Geomicrobium sp. JCM 19039]|uniref:alpha/beta fold hydrolase n=1 Tax=Geomicrobium sp. JCM 19039 TaxID=1460636 RepID=UPI00187D0869|nr:alpha/beta hydrolase [Geomicrobium sp. JCM 19039]
MRIVIFVSIGVSIFISILFVSFIYHQVQLVREEAWIQPMGEMVDRHGIAMHVYTEGAGEHTLVFMAGGGTSAPVFDFLPLYKELADRHTVVVIEKAGYGFSEVTDQSRDIDTILAETREALRQAGVDGPYVLVPHSMSGIEAIYWTEQYPEEVTALIGLDMATPEAYENMAIPMPLVHAGSVAANLGLTRWIPSLVSYEVLEYGTFTEHEEKVYRALQHRRTSTTNMVNEVGLIKENAQVVASGQNRSVPTLQFVSNGEGTAWDEATWLGFQQTFQQNQHDATLVHIDAAHNLHYTNSKQIAEEVDVFLGSVR